MGKNNTFSDTAANRYSLALYELAEENKSVHEIEDQSSALIQLIDDSNEKTLCSSSSIERDIKSIKKNKTEISKIVAEKLAKKAQEKKITKIYFDRGISSPV